MPATKNLCAQISLDLHQKICEEKERSGLTTAQYITNLLTEYFEMKKNGGNQIMANNSRTMAWRIIEMTVREMVTAQYAEQYNRTRANAQQGTGHKCGYKFGPAYGIEGMCMTCYGEHAHEIVEVSDEVVQQVKDAALQSAKDGYGYNDTDYLARIIRKYIQTVDVDKRLASKYTLQQIWSAEADRIGRYIHSQDPSWTVWGQAYDTSILDNYQQGIDVTA